MEEQLLTQTIPGVDVLIVGEKIVALIDRSDMLDSLEAGIVKYRCLGEIRDPRRRRFPCPPSAT